MTHRLVLAVVAVAVLAFPAAVPAATYDVLTCRAAPGAVNHAWEYVASGPSDRLQRGDGCTAPGDDPLGGLWVRETLGGMTSSNAVSGYWTFTAPDGTAVSAVSYSRRLRAYLDPDWKPELLTDSVVREDCPIPPTEDECEKGGPDSSAQTITGLSAASVRIGARCDAPPEVNCGHGATLQRVTSVLYSATVTVSDPVLPTAGALSGTLFDEGWVKGTRTASVTGSDTTGVKSLSLVRDGGVEVASTGLTCDYTYAAPCPLGTQTSSWGSMDVGAWGDGEHVVRGKVEDAAGNVKETATRVVRVDGTAPSAPLAVEAGPEVWTSEAVRELSWLNPGQDAAPIAGASLKVCRRFTSDCLEVAGDSTTAHSLQLPSPGEFEVSVWLADEAGNSDPASSAEVVVGYDPDAPVAPHLGAAARVDSLRFTVPIAWSDGGPAPAGLRGEMCDSTGGGCTALDGIAAGTQTVTVPGSGRWLLRVRAVDAAGNASATQEVQLDATGAGPGPGPGTGGDVRVAPRLRIASARFHGNVLRVKARVPRDLTGALSVRVKPRGRRARVRAVKTGQARVRLRIEVGRRTKRAKVALRFAGDSRYLPAKARLSARR